MNKFIINKEASLIKNILIEGSKILASDEDYGTKEIFLEKINNNKKYFLDTHINITTNDILKFILFEEEKGIQIFFETTKKSKTYFEFDSLKEYNEFKDYLIIETNFNLKKEQKSNFKSWIKKALYSFVAIIFTGVTFSWAIKLENGNIVDTGGGRRQGLKNLLLMLAENLGSTNVLIIGTLIVFGLSFWTYKAYIKGKEVVKSYSW